MASIESISGHGLGNKHSIQIARNIINEEVLSNIRFGWKVPALNLLLS
jgi:hypothetical protein